MPLISFDLRNEYGLGQPELYRNVDREDPKAVLDGVAVAGLVGILRQLGDLADFAAEMFHGIQEEVMTTASRSNKLMIRLQHIEAAVPSLEKTALEQTSHIHFAYTAGREWHPPIPNGQNHFIYNDLPRFIMDSYEECRGPPRLHLLDKFDIDGPGSCLKRYSDPTYFRRVSGSQIRANNEIKKDKKNRKTKRKKSSQKSQDMSRLASMADQKSRKQFTSSSFGGQTSSSRTTSTVEMRFKPDLQDHSFSFDSRSGSASAYAEHLSNVASSVKAVEKPPRASSSSSLTQRTLTIASILSDSQSEDADDNFPHSPSLGQTGRGSSCVSWDEKAEIVDSNALKCVKDEAPETMQTSFVVDAPGATATASDEVRTGGDDFHSNDVETAESVSSLKQQKGLEEGDIQTGREIEREPPLGRELKMDSEYDESESEGDNYVDALNTIESESENDQGLGASQEVQKSSSEIKKEGLESSAYQNGCAQPRPSGPETKQNSNNIEGGRLVEGFTDHSLGTDETTCAASDTGNTNRTTCSFLEPASSVNASDKQIPRVSRLASDINISLGDDLCATRDAHKSSKGDHDKNPKQGYSAPGYSLSGSSNPLYMNGTQEQQQSEEETSHDVQSVKIWTNGSLLGLEPSKPQAFDDPYAGKEKSDNSNQTFANGLVLTNSSMATPGTDHSVGSDVKAIHAGDQQESHKTSSGVFSLSHRLLVNGFRRKDSFAHDRKIVPATIPENTELTEKSEFFGQAIEEKTFKDPFLDETPFDWLTSSPPLEHMKISFNPTDSPRISPLKLKFPDGDQCYKGNKYAFSSFQLVPEPAGSFADTDSDDDTFCRSSSGVTDDDYLSDNCSVSNSEQWEESGDSPERKDRELYASLQRHMHTEPSSLSTPLPDVPSFEILKSSIHIETTKDPVSGNFSYLQNPAEPLPPPLPPVQWRVSKISTEGFEDKQQSLQDELKRAFDQRVPLSTSLQQSNVASVKKEPINVAPAVPKPEKNVHQKKSGQEEKQNGNANEMETGDFLHQIRMKQFNLRRTATTRPLAAAPTSTGPTTNRKINAILEKANSIRQAVASDDGDETDTWSDT